MRFLIPELKLKFLNQLEGLTFQEEIDFAQHIRKYEWSSKTVVGSAEVSGHVQTNKSGSLIPETTVTKTTWWKIEKLRTPRIL